MNPADKDESDSWHSLPIEEVFKKLNTSRFGYSQFEAMRRLQITKNKTLEEPKNSLFHLFLRQLHRKLIILLLLLVLLSNFI